MTRLTKKCLAASAVTHGLLLVIVVVGSAFIPAKPKFQPPAFEFVPLDAKLIEEDLVGGGNPNVTEVPQQAPLQQVPQTQATPQPQPQKVQQSDPPKPEPKPEKKPDPVKTAEKPVDKTPDPPKVVNDRFKLDDKSKIKKIDKPEKTETAKKTIDFDTSKVVRKKITPENSDSSNAADAAASKAQAKALAQRSAALEQILGKIQSGVSGSTSIEFPGPGGQAYVGYGIYLKKIYEEAWIPPAAARDNEPIVAVEIVVAKDGRVLSSQILKGSGNSNLDRSVQNTLNRVKKVRPFPEGSTDEKRTFKLNFNLTTKLAG
jgi:TonB family protein